MTLASRVWTVQCRSIRRRVDVSVLAGSAAVSGVATALATTAGHASATRAGLGTIARSSSAPTRAPAKACAPTSGASAMTATWGRTAQRPIAQTSALAAVRVMRAFAGVMQVGLTTTARCRRVPIELARPTCGCPPPRRAPHQMRWPRQWRSSSEHGLRFTVLGSRLSI